MKTRPTGKANQQTIASPSDTMAPTLASRNVIELKALVGSRGTSSSIEGFSARRHTQQYRFICMRFADLCFKTRKTVRRVAARHRDSQHGRCKYILSALGSRFSATEDKRRLIAFLRAQRKGMTAGNDGVWLSFFVFFKWRRGWDSNPRYGFPHARFRGEYFKPLSHLSAVFAIQS
jgi:hypothetical protein